MRAAGRLRLMGNINKSTRLALAIGGNAGSVVGLTGGVLFWLVDGVRFGGPKVVGLAVAAATVVGAVVAVGGELVIRGLASLVKRFTARRRARVVTAMQSGDTAEARAALEEADRERDLLDRYIRAAEEMSTGRRDTAVRKAFGGRSPTPVQLPNHIVSTREGDVALLDLEGQPTSASSSSSSLIVPQTQSNTENESCMVHERTALSLRLYDPVDDMDRAAEGELPINDDQITSDSVMLNLC